jgi:hypothetical protein
MNEFVNGVCSSCSKDYNYFYKSGRRRKYCFTCRPPKGSKVRRGSENAYRPPRNFPWGRLPSDWYISKAGNAVRTIGANILVVYPKANRFWMSIANLRDAPRASEIRANAENVYQALSWAERGAEHIFRSYSTR